MILGRLIIPLAGTGLKTGLLSCWEFDSETIGEVTSDSHGSVNSTTTNSQILTSTKKLGAGALEVSFYEGYATMGNNFGFGLSNSFSFSFWLRLYAGSGYSNVLFGKYAGAAGYFMQVANNRLYWFFSDSSSNLKEAYRDISWGYNDATWKHMVVTYDGSGSLNGLRIYINNVNQTLTKSDGYIGAITNSADFRVGANPGGNNDDIINVDQLAVWNISLTAAQVSLLYNSGNGIIYTSW